MILVTGGTGMVGAHLLLHLSKSETAIRAIYRSKETINKTKQLFEKNNSSVFFNNIEWTEGDILDIPSLELAFQNISKVYHCAAKISFDPKDEHTLRKVNIEGTANVVNLCIDFNVDKLCHVSSIAALGDLKKGEEIITEESEWNPEVNHSDYAITKYGAEMEVWRGAQEGLNIVIVNPGVIFGDLLWEEGSGNYFKKIKKGFPFYSYGSTGYVGVNDVVNIMIQLMESSVHQERFIIIAENLSFKNIISLIAEKLNVSKPKWQIKPWMTSILWRINWVLSTFFGIKRSFTRHNAKSLHNTDLISNSKIVKLLNYRFTPVEKVLDECIESTTL